MTHRKRGTCRLCDSKNVELVFPLNPTPSADNYLAANQLNKKQEIYPLDLYLCIDCGHVQLLDVVDQSVLFRDYLYVTSSSLGLVEHYRKYADHVTEKFKFAGAPAMLEVGSNDGSLLKFFKAKGFKVLGVDPAQRIAQKATQDGVETLPEFFNFDFAKQIRSQRGAMSLVVANNVFAHNDDLNGMAKGIRHLLANDGVFVFELPYLGDLVEKRLFDTIYHEHLGYQSVKPLSTFLDRNDLELIHVDRVPTKAGSIRSFAQPKGGPRKRDASVDEILAYENRLKLDKPETYRTLSDDLQKVRAELTQLLLKIKKEGKKVAGYGASPSSTTLIYYFNLQDVMDYLVDDNPIKQGRFSPGCHLPIHPSAYLEKQKPDYVVTLAWTYLDPILERNKNYRAAGGKFIVPLPNVSVV